jgi:D-amino-acid oxidase
MTLTHENTKRSAAARQQDAMSVTVIGAGVIGLTTALVLSRAGHTVRIVASKPPEETTSAVAGAIIGGPMFVKPLTQTRSWQATSVREFHKLAENTDTGVGIQHGRMASSVETQTPEWAHTLSGFRECTDTEKTGYPMCVWISSPIVDMPTYLTYLTNQLIDAGVRITHQTIATIEELCKPGTSVVVNCAGLGAAGLSNDAGVYPSRGQHVVVENPGLTEFFFERDGEKTGVTTSWTGFFPHGEHVVLGGNAEDGNWSREPNDTQTQQILDRCIAVEPRLKNTRILGVEVGLRPMRDTVRLEEEMVENTHVIHNYGHGGIGVTLSWGCAESVLAMVESHNSDQNA